MHRSGARRKKRRGCSSTGKREEGGGSSDKKREEEREAPLRNERQGKMGESSGYRSGRAATGGKLGLNLGRTQAKNNPGKRVQRKVRRLPSSMGRLIRWWITVKISGRWVRSGS